jgi:hypothetical protein
MMLDTNSHSILNLISEILPALFATDFSESLFMLLFELSDIYPR